MSSATQPIGVIARLLDLSERRVQQLSREGVIPRAERGQYDLIGSVRGYVRYLRDQALRRTTGRQTGRKATRRRKSEAETGRRAG
jgi:phage terminase Nu1 subunit (DNA packaging protein)